MKASELRLKRLCHRVFPLCEFYLHGGFSKVIQILLSIITNIVFDPMKVESIFMTITDNDRIFLKQIVLFEFPRDLAEQMKIKINTAHNN